MMDDESFASASTADPKKEENTNNTHSFWSVASDKYVYVSMAVVIVMIGITAAIVVGATYHFLTMTEQHDFESTFEQHAGVIAESLRFHSQAVLGSLETMSTTITSLTASRPEESWPFVSIPDFDRRGEQARNYAYIEKIGFSPLVTYEDRHRWSTFVAYDMEWLGGNASLPTDIYRIDEETGQHVPDDNILTIPFWLTSPRPYNTSLINYNLLSDSLYYYLFNAMIESKHTALSAVYKNHEMFHKLFEPGAHDLSHDAIHQLFNEEHDNSVSLKVAKKDNVSSSSADLVPHSILMTPVYDSFDEETRSLAGILHGILPWDSYFTELLAPGVQGIYCILKNSCGQVFTFKLDGPHVKYVGEGDFVDHADYHDKMAKEVKFGSDFMGQETRTYRQCFYSLIVYPSEEFEDSFETNKTEKFTTLLALVFAALALFFLIFVWFVQRRQERIMGVAIRTSNIISGLFPENVRDRIMKTAEAQANRELKRGRNLGMVGSQDNLKSLLSGDAAAPRGLPAGITIHEDAPIADLYPDCSVFFGDIVGFTSWSSRREPQQVFVLLETLYGAFDELAARRRIFKVETIGDCYVAVTGLPNPRRDHALAMARFATDVLVKSREVFHCLEGTLGPGTNGLNMRLGIHSGPVTAGVLRGEKGRFQLFGDTVNTAARMESNSAPGRILCSASTAELILEAGKSSWIQERPDKVNAKGKGTMVTYWVNANKSRSSTSHESQTFNSTSEHSSRQGPSSFVASKPTSTDLNNSEHIVRQVRHAYSDTFMEEFVDV